MMGFQVVVLWSDILIWLLVAAGVGCRRADREKSAAACRLAPGRGQPRWHGLGDCSARLHSDRPARFAALPRRSSMASRGRKRSTGWRCLSALDALAGAAAHAQRKNLFGTLRHPPLCQGDHRPAGAGETVRDYPRLKHGGKPISASARATSWPRMPAFSGLQAPGC